MDLLKASFEVIKRLLNRMNPLVQSTAKHLGRVLLTETSLTSVYSLHPDIRDKVIDLVTHMQSIGLPVYLAQTFRSAEEQDRKYAQGRTSPGEIITNAQGLESAHQYGLAVDFMFTSYDYTSNIPSDSMWLTLGQSGEARGLVWGGRWPGLVDRPHFEHPQFETSRQALLEFFKK